MLSVGAILLLFLLSRRGTAAGVSSLLHLVPPATALQGDLLFGERLAPVAVLGIAIVAAGVALVLRDPCGQRAVHVRYCPTISFMSCSEEIMR